MKRDIAIKICVAVAAIFFTSISAISSHALGIRARSLGGAFRAVASSNDIIFYNPAGLLKNRRVAADLDYGFDKGDLHNLSVSIVDSSTSSWGMGLAYGALMGSGRKYNAHMINLGLAMPLVTDVFSLGGSFYYWYDPLISDSGHKHFFNMDVAVMADLPMGLSFALVLDHLLAPKSQEKSMGLSLGGALDFGKIIPLIPLTLSLDWSMADLKSNGDQKHGISAGFEYMAFAFLPLRLGFQHEPHEGNKFISLGSGVVLPGFSLDAVYQQHLSIGRMRNLGLALRFSI